MGSHDSTGEYETRAPVPEGWGVTADTAETWDCVLCSLGQEESWRTRHDQGGMDWVLSCGERVPLKGMGVQARIHSRNAGFWTDNSDPR